jgi:hypothetical protein
MTKLNIAEKIRELEERHRNELMGEDERLELGETIIRLRRKARVGV